MTEKRNPIQEKSLTKAGRIAILANSAVSFGGGERILGMIIDQLKERGYDICLYSYGEEWRNEQSRFGSLRILKEVPVLGHKYKAYRELVGALRKDKPGCLICFSLAFGEVAVWAARKVGVPFLTSERCDPWRFPVPGKESVHRWLRMVTFRMASGIVFQTEQVQGFFPNSITAHSKVIPNPIIDNNLPEPRLKGDKVIVSVGRFSDQKRHDLLIEAFAALPAGHGYTLKIYGEGPLQGELERQISRLGLNDSVKLMGQAKRVVDHLGEADIFVLTSDHEGMPNALIEGMAMGLACISTDFASGGGRHLIKDGENGLLIPVGDVKAMTAAMNRLITDPELKAKLRRNAPSIRESHSKDIIIPLWIDYITELSKSRNR